MIARIVFYGALLCLALSVALAPLQLSLDWITLSNLLLFFGIIGVLAITFLPRDVLGCLPRLPASLAKRGAEFAFAIALGA